MSSKIYSPGAEMERNDSMVSSKSSPDKTLIKLKGDVNLIYERIKNLSFAEFGIVIYMLIKKWCSEKDRDTLQFVDTLKALLADGQNQSPADQEEKKCSDHANQIRNSKGKLICEIFHDNEAWVVAIKKKDVYSFIVLNKDGSHKIVNENDNDPINSILRLKLTT